MPTTTTTTCAPDLDGKWRIEVIRHCEPGWLGRLVGLRASQTRETYIGSGTVWRRYPTFKRCSTTTEVWLADLWEGERYRRKAAKGGASA
jgi:hypothetical protein